MGVNYEEKIMKQKIELSVNGEVWEVEAAPHRTLLEVLREDLGLTGAKEGCGLGTCGSCTVLIDDAPMLSCLTLALEAQGKNITTIEGLMKDNKPDPLQEAFVNHGALQCGWCTPGAIMSSKALLENNPNPSREEIREALAGNLCRCTGYKKIVEAVESVTKE